MPQATTYNTPNYQGDLYNVTPTDTPFLSAIGGLTGGIEVADTEFSWQEFDLRDASATRQRLEGADAPDAESRVRIQVKNVVEIHQEAVNVSYTKQAATARLAATPSGTNPVQDEAAWQIEQQLKQVARDTERSFIVGTYNLPADNTTARRTRGILQAIETNVVDAEGLVLTDQLFLDLIQSVWTSGGLRESERATVIVNAFQKRQLTRIFVTEAGYAESTRNLGGVNVTTIETDFGTLNIMLNRHMPASELAVVSLEQCAPAHLVIPGKGTLFVEELAKTGASLKYQLYGEIGLRYGNEKCHGKITDLATVLPVEDPEA